MLVVALCCFLSATGLPFDRFLFQRMLIAMLSMFQLAGGMDVHIPYNSANNDALCLEILGKLRRSLTQQAAVRHTLYQVSMLT